MLFGHRNNAEGYGKAIEEIDDYLEDILPLISENDLLIITADHGCDPTVEGTDHTREYVPVLYYSKGIEPKNLGMELGFDSISQRVLDWLF
jgi:phosphopentomutase